MFGYYLNLAFRSLKRNPVLTALVVTAVGVGIGVCMTALTTLHAMSGNPIPDKSSHLFVPDINAWDPIRGKPGSADSQFSYRDATALLKAHRGVHQVAMYQVVLNVSAPGGRLVHARGRATSADFFTMFEAPFRSGHSWGQREDDNRENVVVLGAALAQRVFPHVDPVGQTITLSAHEYRVVGVLRPWTPTPRFYDLINLDFNAWAYGESEDFFIPLSTAIDRQMPTHSFTSCMAEDPMPPGWAGRLNSGCYWLQFWVELDTAAQIRDFTTFVQGYVTQQQRLGLYHYPPRVQLLDVMHWLTFNHVVSDSVRINTMIAAGLLIVCLVNAVGLMLAKLTGKAADLSVRRALGASQTDLFIQCLVETMILGVASAALGLVLTAAGLWGIRELRGIASQNSAMGRLYTIDTQMAFVIVIVAVAATVLTGLYPTLRAVRIAPAWQLKIQ